MTEETFESFLTHFKRYALELSDRDVFLPAEKIRTRLGNGTQSPLRVIMCGMGESLMHRKCPEWIGRIRKEVGVRVTIVTNGLLLKEKVIQQLVDNEVTVVLVSVPGIDQESYSRYMMLDWERILDNIMRCHQALPGRVQINATIPDDAEFTPEQVEVFWSEKGISIAGISRCHNRGGFLQDESLTGRFGKANGSFCGIIARHNFIAWDGKVLSCCHDLHAENVIGDVLHDDFMTIAHRKTPNISEGPKYRICSSCNDCERAHAGQIFVGSTKKFHFSEVLCVKD